ncbi:unnamed protein product [Acanthoscelides obtectus]|nr:unnamed protein product [Acanthoscelides obtectus]CAK1650883.1 Glucose dehydrogenase [FAD, quinone] [Acanthoscelides obtectus]
MKYAKGKGLGGSSIVNFMIYTRGNKIDYEKWEEMGNPGWSYEGVLPYFIKAEDALIAIKDNEYHGHGGYMKVSDSNFRTKSVEAWVGSAIEAGHKYVDYNGNVEALTYVKTNLTDPEHPTWPDIELIFLAGTPATDFGLYIRQIFNIPKETFNVVWKPLIGKPGFTVLTQLMHPISVGYIRLRSKDSLDEPRYFTNFFSDPENIDVRAHIAGIREGQRIVSQPTMQRYGARIVDTPIPGRDREF